jgi:hypothetical protein
VVETLGRRPRGGKEWCCARVLFPFACIGTGTGIATLWFWLTLLMVAAASVVILGRGERGGWGCKRESIRKGVCDEAPLFFNQSSVMKTFKALFNGHAAVDVFFTIRLCTHKSGLGRVPAQGIKAKNETLTPQASPRPAREGGEEN